MRTLTSKQKKLLREWFNKNYDDWDVPLHKGFDPNRHKYLVRLVLNPKERTGKGWNASRRGGGRPVSESGRCADLVNELLYGTGDIKKLYSSYLTTKHWRYVRLKKIESVGGECETCSARDDLDVHHLTYTTLGREVKRDLAALCRSCHRKNHNLVSLSPVKEIGLQRVKLIRFTGSKAMGLLKDNQQVTLKQTKASTKASHVGGLRPPKTSSKQVVSKKEKKENSKSTVNIVTTRDANAFGMHLRTLYHNCCNPNIDRHMEILKQITSDQYQEAVDLVKQAKEDEVSYWEVMEWIAKEMELETQSN